MIDITTQELRSMIKDTRRLVIFAGTRAHAKTVERLCAEAKRSVISQRWGVTLPRCLRIWDIASQTDAGLVLVLQRQAAVGWRTVGDAVVWVDHTKPEPNSPEALQVASRVLVGPPSHDITPVFVPAYFCRVSVATLETQPAVA